MAKETVDRAGRPESTRRSITLRGLHRGRPFVHKTRLEVLVLIGL